MLLFQIFRQRREEDETCKDHDQSHAEVGKEGHESRKQKTDTKEPDDNAT